ncbi:MAG: hypothetical protein R3B40_12480 [Polyangiales bacterium]|nr:hypothetical protein [Myxococcales bacterium]MCB9661777.1 hypothetical protein [Sandaracinaceae bacterium]
MCCTKNEQYPRGDERLDTTVFEEVAGQDTPTILGETVQFLAERYGVIAACAPVPVIDINNSDFITGNFVLADGAFALYTADDLAGGPCPQTNLDPRQPSFYLETIEQSGDFEVSLSARGIPLPIHSDVTLVQVLILPAKSGLVLGGTYAADHGPYELIPLDPSDLTVPYDDLLYGTMVVDWRARRTLIHFESLEPNTTTPAGGKRQTMLLESPLFGTGVYEATYRAMARSWAEDPELTGNPVIGVPRNPILTPRRVDFRYHGAARFPYVPETGVHAPCESDFSDPAHLEICPSSAPTAP